MPRQRGTIGAMRERWTIQQNVVATDVLLGQGADNWQTVEANVPVEVTPLSGSERVQAQAVSSQVAYVGRMRYRSTVTARMRAVWHDKLLSFQSVVLENGRKDYLLIDCAEVI